MFTTKPGDNRPARVLIGMGLLFVVAFLGVYFQPQNRGDTTLFVLLTISVLASRMLTQPGRVPLKASRHR